MYVLIFFCIFIIITFEFNLNLNSSTFIEYCIGNIGMNKLYIQVILRCIIQKIKHNIMI